MALVRAPKKRTSGTTTEDSNPTDLPKPPKKEGAGEQLKFHNLLGLLDAVYIPHEGRDGWIWPRLTNGDFSVTCILLSGDLQCCECSLFSA